MNDNGSISVYQEMMFEIYDLRDFISHIMCNKGNHGFIQMAEQKTNRTANDNWPIYETEKKSEPMTSHGQKDAS